MLDSVYQMTLKFFKTRIFMRENVMILPYFTQRHNERYNVKIVSEYDQEIPQSQNADNRVAPRGRAAK